MRWTVALLLALSLSLAAVAQQRFDFKVREEGQIRGGIVCYDHRDRRGVSG